MKCNLYIIKNKINIYVYIGQTSHSIEHRFKLHIKDALYKDGQSNKFHKELVRLGIDNFYLELLGIYEHTQIDEEEIKAIEKYNSYYNGYNGTLGGQGNKSPVIVLTDDEEKYIITEYSNNKSISEICNNTGYSVYIIKKTLLKYNVEIRHQCKKEIVMYDNDFNPIMIHESIWAAYRWAESEYVYNDGEPNNFYYYVKKACYTHGVAFSYRWQLLSELEYDGFTFLTIQDRDAYINGKDIITNKGIFSIVIDRTPKTYCCINCGGPIFAGSKTQLCIKCVNAYGKPMMPTKDELLKDLRTMSIKKIALKYERSPGTVHYWLKKYGIH